MMRILARALIALAIATGSAGVAAAEARLALVIEQVAYRGNLAPLPGAAAEADAVAGALASLGFSVARKKNLDRRGLEAALQDYRREVAAKPGAIAFLYYTGHGARDPQSEAGENYLLGVEADLYYRADLVAAGVQLSEVTDQLAATGARAVVIVADACRNTPNLANKAAIKGFAPMAAAENMLVAYSTDLGDVAQVGAYAPVLAAELVRPGRDLVAAFNAVQREVARRTEHRQKPWSNNRIYDEICLAGCEPGAVPPASPPAPVIDPDAAAWSAVARDCDAKAYLAAFPKGAYAAAAAIRAGRCDEAARPKPGDPVDEPPGRSEPARFSVSADGKPVVDGATVTAATPAGTVFKDCADCPEMIVIPAGAFLMGSPASESGRGEDEDDAPGAGGRPRRVTFPRAFAVGKFEVTWDEWEACVRGGACDQGPVDKAGGDNGWGKGARPVIEVSWNDAKAYVRWLSAKTGQRYRLLSEAEWEYAARAGGQARWSFGDDEARLGDHAWHYGNSGGRTQPVGGKAANAFGLHDMHGNVWEWVEDCYADSYSAGQPSDGSAYTTPSCSSRVVRGGSWLIYPNWLRSAYRGWNSPTVRYYSIGFRLARTVSP